MMKSRMLGKITKGLLLVLVTGIVAVGCLSRGETMNNFSESAYEAALERFDGSDQQIDAGIKSFELGYGNLAHADLRQRIEALYAPEIYFNDTIHTHTTRDGLVDYLGRTGDGLEESTVEIRQVLRDGNDVFVRWSMEFKTRAVGREVHSRSIGMTHLRFNEQGQVLVHQDFWDSGHALYAQLPIIGFFIRRAHARM